MAGGKGTFCGDWGAAATTPLGKGCGERKKNPGSSESQGGGGLQLLPGAIGLMSQPGLAGLSRLVMVGQ